MAKQVSCPVCDSKWEVVERCPCDGWELGEKWVLTPDPEAYERAYRERLERAREAMAQFKAGALGLGEEGLQQLRERLKALDLEPGPALADWARQNRPEPRTNEGAKVVDGRAAGRTKSDVMRFRRFILLDLPIHPSAQPILALALISPALGIDPIVGGRLVLLLTSVSTIRSVWRRRWRRSVLWVILGVPWGTLAVLAPKWAIFWALGVQAAVLGLLDTEGGVLPHVRPFFTGPLVASMFVNLALGARLVAGEGSVLPTVGVTAVVAGFLLGVGERVYCEELLTFCGIVSVATGLIGHFAPGLTVVGLIAITLGAMALFNEGASESSRSERELRYTRKLELKISRQARLTTFCGCVALTAGLVGPVRPVQILVGSIFIAVAALLFLTLFKVARPWMVSHYRGMLASTLIVSGTVGVVSALVWKLGIWAAVGGLLRELRTALPEVIVKAFKTVTNTLETVFETFAPVWGIELVVWLVVLIAYQIGVCLWPLMEDAE